MNKEIDVACQTLFAETKGSYVLVFPSFFETVTLQGGTRKHPKISLPLQMAGWSGSCVAKRDALRATQSKMLTLVSQANLPPSRASGTR